MACSGATTALTAVPPGVVMMLLEGNPDVCFVYKEFPTLAASSRFAAQAALAARRQSPALLIRRCTTR